MNTRHQPWIGCLLMALCLSAAGCTGRAVPSGDCGDGTCGSGETCSDCAADCGACGTCGNTTCDAGETCSGCAADCGACATSADATCDAGETCSGCAADCGAGPTTTQCDDGIDNDGDGLVDWEYDLGCTSQHDDDEAATARSQEGGFTTFDPSANSLLVYVSASQGVDTNDGSSPAQAVKTLARGAALIRDGHPDFLLLRRGDVWRNEDLGRFKSGQDAQHPLVIASYGELAQRPRVEIRSHFIDHNGQVRNHVAILGLELVPYGKIPGDAAFDGATGDAIRYVGGGTGLLIEDCLISYGEIVVQSYGDGNVYDGVEIRRNVIEKAYHVGTCGQNNTYRPSGLYASHARHLTIEGNLFDHNGWNEDVDTACATMYNHNMYLNAHGLVIRENIVSRASSMGIKMRSDEPGAADEMLFENNLLVDGELGIGIGGNTEEPGRFLNAIIRRNVFTQIGLSNPTDRDFAWMLGVSDHVTTRIEDNHFLHQPWFSNAYAIRLLGGSMSDVTISGNWFYDLKGRALQVQASAAWSNVAVSGNTFVDPAHGSCLVDHAGVFTPLRYQSNAYSSSSGTDWFCVGGARKTLAEWATLSGESGASAWSGALSAPDRTVGSYAAHLGLGSSLETFIEAARTQSRLSWRGDLSAGAVNDYLRAGFP